MTNRKGYVLNLVRVAALAAVFVVNYTAPTFSQSGCLRCVWCDENAETACCAPTELGGSFSICHPHGGHCDVAHPCVA